MAKIADVLATERNRQQPQEWNKIHLFQMGDFYRAYEWSAWLIVAITYSDKVRHQQQGDRKPLKVSKKTLASGGSDFCFVGFPIKSLEKFVPERTDFTSNEEKHIVVTIQLPQPTDGTEVTYERLHEAFQKWRDGILLSAKPDDIDADGEEAGKNRPDSCRRTAASSTAATGRHPLTTPGIQAGDAHRQRQPSVHRQPATPDSIHSLIINPRRRHCDASTYTNTVKQRRVKISS